MTMNDHQYMEDSQGRLVPVEQVKEIDKLRDSLVREKAVKIKALQAEMKQLKKELFGDVDALIDISLDRYEVKIGGKKGNVTLSSFDGRLELRRQISEHITFDEGLYAAKALIDECLRDWSKDTGPLRVIVEDAFQVDKKGRINTARILGLRRHDIDDERWQRAMTAISEAVRTNGTTAYIRLYERDEYGKMQAVPLDFAAL